MGGTAMGSEANRTLIDALGGDPCAARVTSAGDFRVWDDGDAGMAGVSIRRPWAGHSRGRQ
jgi:hypothetical protein